MAFGDGTASGGGGSSNGSLGVHDNYITANGNSSAGTMENTETELYTVIWSLLAMLTLSILGIGANAAILVCTRCKRSVRNLYYGLFYNTCVLNLLLCVFWMPLHFAQLVENFSGRGARPGLCYVNVCLLHGMMAALVCCMVFLTVQRLYHMWRLSAKGTNLVAAGGIAAAWVLAAIAAVAVAIEFPHTIPYAVCVGASVSFVSLQKQRLQDPTVTAVLATLYFVILILTFITLLILLLLKRQTLSRLLKLKYTPHDMDTAFGQGQDVSTGSEQVSPKRQGPESNSSGGEQQTNNSTADSLLSGQLIQAKESEGTADEDDEEEEDDDTFDMKMRQRHRDSGRRHTVANIGLGDPGFGGRRGSLGNISDRSPTGVAHNYQYVRKWSVDIVALQDQLENPKSLTPMLPFQELHQKLKDLDQPITGAKEEQKETEKLSPSIDSQGSKPTKKKKTVQLDNRIEEIDDIHDSMEPLSTDDLPSIVVNGNNAATETECVRTPLGGSRQGGMDNEHLAQIDKELTKSSKLIALLLLVILCIVPYVVVQILRSSMSSHLNYNLSQVTATALLIQAPLLPALFAWVDPRLLQALRRLKQHLTNWRCVCYCNIGKSKGKACFGRPNMHYEGTSTA